MNYFFIILIGIAAGISVSTASFSIISSIGIVERMASKTRTANHIKTYENAIMLGVLFFNILFVFNYFPSIGRFGISIIGIFSGIYVGTLLMALAETLKMLPLLAKRAKIKVGIPYLVASIAFGKLLGSLFSLCYK